MLFLLEAVSSLTDRVIGAFNSFDTGHSSWTILATRSRHGLVGFDNFPIKAPATVFGIEAFFRLTVEGLPVTVTLILCLRCQEESHGRSEDLKP
ncbi:transaldolase family protein [Ferribacterium limneticum]|uniref:transaldolase family protein n=1 Tax=Ferribacterium limneticum TaxID=76259 RepID=UPI001CFB001B|nr:transaldolase family protein [Ferribacterium limneticum]UCV17975.1 hypothetical protein KI610_14295 [Ferribacterium limneticum]